jgi:hypothetical protein
MQVTTRPNDYGNRNDGAMGADSDDEDEAQQVDVIFVDNGSVTLASKNTALRFFVLWNASAINTILQPGAKVLIDVRLNSLHQCHSWTMEKSREQRHS